MSESAAEPEKFALSSEYGVNRQPHLNLPLPGIGLLRRIGENQAAGEIVDENTKMRCRPGGTTIEVNLGPART